VLWVRCTVVVTAHCVSFKSGVNLDVGFIPINNCICLLLRSLLYHFFIVDYLDNCFQVINSLELISAQEDP
jgi:hypothetical protein